MPVINKPTRPLPQAAINALQADGVGDIALTICIDKNGNQHVLRGDGVNDSQKNTFPIATTEIQDITPMSAVKYKGSTCITYVQGGVAYTVCW